jgi:hypothetical protein
VSRDLGYGAMEAVNPSLAGAADVAFTAYMEMAIDGRWTASFGGKIRMPSGDRRLARVGARPRF